MGQISADRTHGLRSTYAVGCRCEPCRTAAVLYKARWRRAQGIPEQRRGRTCGLVSTYIAGCRCDECRRAARERKRQERKRKHAARGAPFECLDCPATFWNRQSLTQHSEMIHFGAA